MSQYREAMDRLKKAFSKSKKSEKNNAVYQKKECDSVGGVGAQLMKAGEPKSILASFRAKESARWARCFKSPETFRERARVSPKVTVEAARFLERDSIAADATRFEIALISEGLGNFSDAYFYPNDVLREAAAVFEGKKIYADHPRESEEKELPERSVKDIIGHIENVRYRESKGQGTLIGEAVIMPGSNYDWARTMMRQAIEYSRKYPDKNFIGLSINAGGTSQPIDMEELARAEDISEAARMKVVAAREQGIRTAKLVNEIKSAVSCDLVTQAGAGGRVLSEK